MTMKLTSRNVAFFVAGGFFAALFVGGVAHAITSTIFQYSSPQTSYLSIPAAAFTPANSNYTYFKDDRSIVPGSINTEACFTAPVNLPDAVKIQSIGVFYTRSINAQELTLFFNRLDLVTGSTGDALLNKQLVPNNQYGSAAFKIVTNVNNRRYTYVLTTCMQQDVSGEVELHAVRVAYTYANAGS